MRLPAGWAPRCLPVLVAEPGARRGRPPVISSPRGRWWEPGGGLVPAPRASRSDAEREPRVQAAVRGRRSGAAGPPRSLCAFLGALTSLCRVLPLPVPQPLSLSTPQPLSPPAPQPLSLSAPQPPSPPAL
ncbi:hypothetical protein P7K49_015118 [Saguinus oedipus]|uniref:Uncharacterized protein n=1 Tax=Saguinus oedipus TaxID=9490 RepID=A0ABQ9V8A9_SAGOE|nr:hypothetical protein P7K49_015118 [Saguinus oedipus]